jgi:hypothetical protein
MVEFQLRVTPIEQQGQLVEDLGSLKEEPIDAKRPNAVVHSYDRLDYYAFFEIRKTLSFYPSVGSSVGPLPVLLHPVFAVQVSVTLELLKLDQILRSNGGSYPPQSLYRELLEVA